MDSSSEEEVRREMNRTSKSKLTIRGNRGYKEHFKGQKKVAELIGDIDDSETSREVWLGRNNEDHMVSKDASGEDQITRKPKRFENKKILSYPLGAIGVSLSNEMHSRKEDEELVRRSKKQRRERAESLDSFIVPDGVIDPHLKRKHKKKNDQRGYEVVDLTDTDEVESPKKKMGRASTKKDVVSPSPKRGRGRPPKDKSKEEPQKKNETSSRKEKEKASPIRRGGKKVAAMRESSDEIEVVEEPERRKNGGKQSKEVKSVSVNRKKKMIESEENQDEPINTKRVGRQSKNKSNPLASDESDVEEEPVKSQKAGRSKKGKTREIGKTKNPTVSLESDDEEVEPPPKRISRSNKKDTSKSVEKRRFESDRNDEAESSKKGRKSDGKKKNDVDALFNSSGDEEEIERINKKSKGESIISGERKRNRNSDYNSLFDSDVEDRRQEKQSERGNIQGGSRKRNAREMGESEDNELEEDEMSVVESNRRRADGRSSSRTMREGRDESRTAEAISKEKERLSKEKRKKAEEKKRQKGHRGQFDAKVTAITDREVGIRQKRMSEAGIEEEHEHHYYTSRKGPRSRNGEVPSVGGSRSGSEAGSRVGSRAGSPVGDDPMDGGRIPMEPRNVREVARQLREDKEREEREEDEKRERERKKRESGGLRPHLPPAPPPPARLPEKSRIKAKVWTGKASRDPGIVDTLPPSTSNLVTPPSMRGARGGGVSSNGRGRGRGRGGGGGGTRSSINGSSSFNSDLFDNIIGEMNKTGLPGAPSSSAPYENPSKLSLYHPEVSVAREPLNERMEYRGGAVDIDDIEGMNGRRSALSDGRRSRSSNGMNGRRSALSDGRRSRSSNGMGDDHNDPIPPQIDGGLEEGVGGEEGGRGGGGMGDDSPPFQEGPVEILDLDEDMDRRNDGYNANGDGPFNFNPIQLESVETPVFKAEDKHKANEILAGIVRKIEEGKFDEVIWALDWKKEIEKRSFFDRQANRDVIYQLIEGPQIPSDKFFHGLRRLFDWDAIQVINDSNQKRIGQSGYRREWLSVKPNVHFGAIPFFIEDQSTGVLKSRITPLSEAVMLNKLEWALFLLKSGAIANYNVMHNGRERPIIGLAIDIFAEKNQAKEEDLKMIRLLLAFGANRQTAWRYLKSRHERDAPQFPLLSDFNAAYPYYPELLQLLDNARSSVAEILKKKIMDDEAMGDHFQVDWVKETVCTLPDFNFLVVRFEEYYENEKNKEEAVFAVVVGTSSHDVIEMHEEDRDFFNDVKIGDIDLVYSGREQFSVKPCVKINPGDNEDPDINQTSILPLESGVNIFIVPPILYERLSAFTIKIRTDRVHDSKIIFGGLARLSRRSEVANASNKKGDVTSTLLTMMGPEFGKQFEELLRRPVQNACSSSSSA